MDKLFVDDNALALYYASLEGRVDALEEGGGGNGSKLPDVTSSDNGKVLTVSSGKWAAKAAATELPAVTSSDNGKVLGVSGGKWAKQTVPTELPTVSSSDNGKVLAVSNGAWSKQAAPTELPSVTASDEGKVLTVANGAWAKAEPSGGGGGVFVVNVDDETSTFDKTYAEIKAAMVAGKIILLQTVTDVDIRASMVNSAYRSINNLLYTITSGPDPDNGYGAMYTTDSENGYPSLYVPEPGGDGPT